jgi:PKD repeat protein
MRRIVTSIFTLAFVLISLRSFTGQNGPGGGLANAPGEQTCRRCHSGTALNGGSGSLSDFLLEDDFTGGGYIPDSTYTLKLKFKQSSIRKWGFNITAMTTSDTTPAGDFTIISSRTQRQTQSINSKVRKYVEHTRVGTTSSSDSISWEFDWTAPSSIVDTIRFFAVINACNNNGSTSGDQVYAKSFDVVPSSDLPTARAYTTDTLVCANETVTFADSSIGATSQYSWQFPGGSPSISSLRNPTTSYTSGGTYNAIFRVKNQYGWSKYDTVQIKVKSAPTAWVPGGNRTICPGDSAVLIAQFVPGATYTWQDGRKGNKIFATKPGDYNVTVKLGDCSKVSPTVKVAFHNTTKPDISSSVMEDSICFKEPLTLSTTSTNTTYKWFNDTSELGTTTSGSFMTQIDSVAKFYVQGVDNNGCLTPTSDTVSYEVFTRDAAPVVNCTDKKPFSLGFEWPALSSHGGVQVSDDQGKTWVTPTSGLQGKTHSLTGLDPEKDYELWVRGITGKPCVYGEIGKVTCRTGKCSPLDAKITADTAICDGDDVNVEINGLAGANYSLSFDGGAAFTDTSFIFSPKFTGDFKVEVTDSNNLGCPPKELNFSVRVDNIEDLRFRTQRPNNTFCTADTIRFSGTSGNDEYRFYVNNALRATSTDSFYYEDQFMDGDSAYLEVTKGACNATSSTIYISVVPVPNAGFTFSRNHSMYSFAPVNENYKSYFWKFGDGFTSVLMKPDHDYAASANKSVTAELLVTDNNDCEAVKDSVINLPDFVSVIDLKTNGLRLYPNPVNERLFVAWDKPVSDVTRITISTLDGKNVIMFTQEGRVMSTDLSNIAQGIYVIEIQSGALLTRQRLIKN